MADQENTGTPIEGAAPPKQTPPFKPIAATTPAGENDATVTGVRRPMLRRPGEAATGAPPAGGYPAAEPVTPEKPLPGTPVPMAEAMKRKTSRVDLPEMKLPNADGNDTEFKTIKLRPMTTPQPGSSPLPDGPKTLSPSQTQASKSKTSRISLEAALGANDVLQESSAPKTIRLKRPSELSPGATSPIAVPVATARKTTFMPTIPSSSLTAKLPTQTLGAVLPDDEENTPTRRKTIKIKRPSAATGIKINVAHAAGETTEDAADEDMQMVSIPGGMSAIGAGSDTAHWTFIVSAVAALIATLGVIWILAAQAFGPNAAVTGYTAMQGPDIAPPPGLITIN